MKRHLDGLTDNISTLKNLFQKMFEIGFEINRTLKFVLQDLGNCSGALIKLRVLFEIEKASYSEIYSYVLNNEERRKDNRINVSLRGAIIKSIGDFLSIEQNLELALNEYTLLNLAAETIGVEDFDPKQIKNLADVIKNVDITRHKKFETDNNFLCFTQPISRLINWKSLLEKTSLGNCIKICNNIDRGYNDYIIWENFLSAVWEKLTEKNQDTLITEINNSHVQRMVLLHKKLDNEEILTLCRRWKKSNLWAIAADKLDWSCISQELRHIIIEEAIADHEYIREKVANKLASQIRTANKISLVGQCDSWNFLENLLKNKVYKFKTLLRLPKIVENRPSGLLIIKYNNLTYEQLDELISLGFLKWDQDAIDWSKTAIMCSYAILKCEKPINIHELLEKVKEDKPCIDDMLIILNNIQQKIDCNTMLHLSYQIPYEQYTFDDLIKIQLISGYPEILNKAISAIAKKVEEKILALEKLNEE